MRQGWKPAGPRPSAHLRLPAHDQRGATVSVHDSPAHGSSEPGGRPMSLAREYTEQPEMVPGSPSLSEQHGMVMRFETGVRVSIEYDVAPVLPGRRFCLAELLADHQDRVRQYQDH